MRIRFILTVFAAFLSLICHAQDDRKFIVAKAGLNICDVSTKYSRSSYGLTFGFEAQHPIAKKLSLSYGAEFSQQGGKDCYDGENVFYTYTNVRLDYINLPLMLNYYIDNKNILAVKAGIEPEFTITDNCTYWYNGNFYENYYDNSNDNYQTYESYYDPFLHKKTEPVNDLVFSIPLGLSINLKNFMFDARYSIGITNAIDGVNFPSIRTQTLHLTLGYKFHY
ncbi:MAG: PorT family protein [Bacteroidaceae bacterium]|nr:PorT family protein [Bacteroidaceae bacterium]